MRKWYVPHFESGLAVTHLGGRDDSARVAEGKTNFLPMYYIKQVPADPRKLEMSFDCTAFQAQLPKDKPFDDHVFQTIFLNKKHEQTWSMHEIDPAKISTSSAYFAPACLWLMGCSPSRLVAPAVPRVDALPVRRATHVGAQRPEADDVRGRVDARERSRARAHLGARRRAHARCAVP
jgi:hypothetical protein